MTVARSVPAPTSPVRCSYCALVAAGVRAGARVPARHGRGEPESGDPRVVPLAARAPRTHDRRSEGRGAHHRCAARLAPRGARRRAGATHRGYVRRGPSPRGVGAAELGRARGIARALAAGADPPHSRGAEGARDADGRGGREAHRDAAGRDLRGTAQPDDPRAAV